MDTKRTIEMNVLDVNAMVDVMSDGLTIAWVTHALQHTYDVSSGCVVVSVTLTVGQWRGVVDDITSAIVSPDDTSRLRHARNMIRNALAMGQRNIE